MDGVHGFGPVGNVPSRDEAQAGAAADQVELAADTPVHRSLIFALAAGMMLVGIVLAFLYRLYP
jgi:hypothetical protein